jgi:hypothetical protein
MSTITTRQDFKNYCLRRLGFPVIEINVDDDQVEDRIDDALQYWQDYHFDGLQKIYYIKKVTGSQITVSTDISSHYSSNNTIVGATSGATATISGYSGANNSMIQVVANAPFTVGETLQYYDNTGTLQNTTATVTAFNYGEVDKRYVDLTDAVDTSGNPLEIVGISRIFPVQDSQSTINMFDLRYQLRLNELYDFTSASYINYTLTQQHLRSLELLFTGEVPIRYVRNMQRLYIDWAWGASEAPIGTVIVAEAYAVIDPGTYGRVYNDRWLKEYATALIKKAWGENLKKFAGVQLPGGVMLNGDKIYEDAVRDIRRLEDDMEKNYGGILEWFMN